MGVVHIPCHSHIAASGLKRETELCADDIAGLRCYLNASHISGEFPRIRASACGALWHLLDLVDKESLRAYVSPEGEAFKEFVLRVLLPANCADNAQLRWILGCCAPGDWREARFVFIVNRGCSKEAVFKFLVEHLINGFLFRKFHGGIRMRNGLEKRYPFLMRCSLLVFAHCCNELGMST